MIIWHGYLNRFFGIMAVCLESVVNLQIGETAVIVVNEFVNLEQLQQPIEEAGYQICGLVSHI